MRKKFSLFLCLAITVMSLASCGQPASVSQPGAVSTDAPEGGSVAEPGAADELSGEINILHAIDGEQKNALWLQLQDEFHEMHPNVTFESSGTDWGSFVPLLRTRAAAGDMPDIFTGSPVSFPDLIESGLLMDLKAEGLVDQLPLLPEDYAGECEWPDGAIYGAPYTLQTFSCFYNKDIFEEYGLEIPATKTELYEVCETLAANGVDPFIRANAEYTHTYVELKCELVPRLQNSGNGDYYGQLMSGAKDFADYPEFITSVDNMVERYDKWERLDDSSTDFMRAAELFAQGEGAMWVGLSIMIQSAFNVNPDMNMGSFPWPFSDDPSEHANVVESNDLFMVGNPCDVKEEVFEFLKYVYSPENAQRWAEVSGLIMVQNGVDVSGLDPVVQDLVKAKEAGQWVNSCNPSPYGEFVTKWRSYLQAWVGDKSIRTTENLTVEGQKIYDEIIAGLE